MCWVLFCKLTSTVSYCLLQLFVHLDTLCLHFPACTTEDCSIWHTTVTLQMFSFFQSGHFFVILYRRFCFVFVLLSFLTVWLEQHSKCAPNCLVVCDIFWINLVWWKFGKTVNFTVDCLSIFKRIIILIRIRLPTMTPPLHSHNNVCACSLLETKSFRIQTNKTASKVFYAQILFCEFLVLSLTFCGQRWMKGYNIRIQTSKSV